MVRLPAEYQEVEYLESITGAYIDTGYKPSSDTVVNAKYKSTIYGCSPFAVRWSGRSTFDTFGVFTARTDDSVVYYGKYTDGKYITPRISLIDHEITIGVNSVLIDGVSYEISRDVFTQNYNLYLFAMNDQGSAAFGGHALIYAFKLKELSTVVANFIPCYRKSDSEPGMYDLVSGTFFANAGTGEFALGPDCEKEPGRLELLQSLLMAQPHKETATGSNGIATFDTDFKAPVKVVIPFEPVQEGTGDPSPDNFRPISGWTGCEIAKARKNMWNPDTSVSGYLNVNDGSIIAAGSTTKEITSDYIPVPSGTEEISLGFNHNVNVKWKAVALYDANKIFIARPTIDNVSFETINISSYEGVAFCRACLRSYGNSASYAYLAFGDNTIYEPYQATTLPIVFTDPDSGDPLTAYGGTITLNEDGSVDLFAKDVSHTIPGGFTNRGEETTITFEGETLYSTWNYLGQGPLKGWEYPKTTSLSMGWPTKMISNFKKSGVLTDGTGMITFTRDGTPYVVLRLKESLLTDVSTREKITESINEWCANNPIQVCYEVLNPIQYHFDNIGQLKSFLSFLGTNNIWSDLNGDPAVTYWKHG